MCHPTVPSEPKRRGPQSRAVALLIALSASACSSSGGPDDPPPTPEYILSILSSGLTAPVGATVTAQVLVQERTIRSGTRPASGVTVNFSVAAGGGSLATGTAQSGADGVAQTAWTLGVQAGVQLLRAAIAASGSSASVEVSANATPLELVVAVPPSAAAQSGVPFPSQPQVQVRSAGSDVARAGVRVTVDVETGGGSIPSGAARTATTDATGRATFTGLAISGASGQQTLVFRAPDYPDHLPGRAVVDVTPVNLLALTQPPPGSAMSGIPFATQPTVQLKDANGANLAVAGVTVTATVASGSGSLAPAGSATATTNASGQAAFVDLSLVGTGAHTLRFAAADYKPVVTGQISVGPPNVVTLSNATIEGPLADAQGAVRYFSLVVPPSATSLEYNLYGGFGNADLYVRNGQYPTESTFDCRPLLADNTETCQIGSNAGGTWYLMVVARTAYSSSFLKGTFYDAACDQTELVLGTAASGALIAGDCAVPSLRDRLKLILTSQTAYELSMTSSATVSLELKEPVTPRTGYFNVTSVRSVVFLAGPGTYNFDVVAESGVGTTYSLTATSVLANQIGCSNLRAYAGAAVTLTLANTDCTGTSTGTYADRVSVFLGEGQTLTVDMASTGFDPLLKLWTGNGTTGTTLLATDDNGGGGTNARLVYQNTGGRQFLTIEATSKVALTGGNYTIAVNVTPGYSNVIGTDAVQGRDPGPAAPERNLSPTLRRARPIPRR